MSRRVLVTGAASGLGAALVAAFRARGDDVLATDRVAADGIDLVLDITSDADWASRARRGRGALGRPRRAGQQRRRRRWRPDRLLHDRRVALDHRDQPVRRRPRRADLHPDAQGAAVRATSSTSPRSPASCTRAGWAPTTRSRPRSSRSPRRAATSSPAYGVRASAVCPSYFRTNLMDSMQGSDEAVGAVIAGLVERSKVTADDIAAAVLAGMDAGEDVIVPDEAARQAYFLKWADRAAYDEVMRTQAARLDADVMSADVTGARAVREEDAFDVDAVAAWLRANADDPTGLEGTPAVRQFSGGASNLTYLLRYPSRDLILRRAPHGTKAKGAHDMHREFVIQSALAPVFPYVAPMVGFCDDATVIGGDFYVMERIDGSHPAQRVADRRAALGRAGTSAVPQRGRRLRRAPLGRPGRRGPHRLRQGRRLRPPAGRGLVGALSQRAHARQPGVHRGDGLAGRPPARRRRHLRDPQRLQGRQPGLLPAGPDARDRRPGLGDGDARRPADGRRRGAGVLDPGRRLRRAAS